MDKFAAYFNNEDRLQELSEYVHQNFRLICAKMISEMRRKLEITPDLTNSDGYVSLLMTLQGRLFNEMVYSMAGSLQACRMKFTQVIPKTTIDIIFSLIRDKNPLNGKVRTDVKEDLDGFQKYYKENIEELRKVIECLPPSHWPKNPKT